MAYLDGLEADGTVSFKGDEEGAEEEGFPAEAAGGPTVRREVDAGTDVIDITAMRAELEKQKRGG
jgi:hypothetical protein